METNKLMSENQVLQYFIDNQGYVKNNDIVTYFRSYLSNPAIREEARAIFKTYVNKLASVKVENGEKYLVLKRQYYPQNSGNYFEPTSGLPPIPQQYQQHSNNINNNANLNYNQYNQQAQQSYAAPNAQKNYAYQQQQPQYYQASANYSNNNNIPQPLSQNLNYSQQQINSNQNFYQPNVNQYVSPPSNLGIPYQNQQQQNYHNISASSLQQQQQQQQQQYNQNYSGLPQVQFQQLIQSPVNHNVPVSPPVQYDFGLPPPPVQQSQQQISSPPMSIMQQPRPRFISPPPGPSYQSPPQMNGKSRPPPYRPPPQISSSNSGGSTPSTPPIGIGMGMGMTGQMFPQHSARSSVSGNFTASSSSSNSNEAEFSASALQMSLQNQQQQQRIPSQQQQHRNPHIIQRSISVSSGLPIVNQEGPPPPALLAGKHQSVEALGSAPPVIPPRSRSKRSENKTTSQMEDLDELGNKENVSRVNGSYTAAELELQKISVKERTQKFNRIASESDFGIPNGNNKSSSNRSKDKDRRDVAAKHESGDYDTSSLSSYSYGFAQMVQFDPQTKEWMLKAAKSDYNGLYKMLQENPGLVKRKDINGYTALHWASKHGKVELIKLLAGTFRSDVNAKSNGGYSPLHLAAQFSRHDAFELLVQTYGADPNLRDHSGKKPMQYITRTDHNVSIRVSDKYTKLKEKRRSSERESRESFLRIGSLNVRVKKTTEAFGNFLGKSNSSNNIERMHKSWGSADGIDEKDSHLMPPPPHQNNHQRKTSSKGKKRNKRSVEHQEPSTAPAPHNNVPKETRKAKSDSDSDTGGFGEWHSP